jgi:hypothetical protein
MGHGPVVLSGSTKTLTTLSIPQAGNYVIWSKLYVQGVDTIVTCQLSAGGDYDQTRSDSHTPFALSLNISVHSRARVARA